LLAAKRIKQQAANMAHDVFISHASSDKPVADSACAALENAGIRCWIAPRDVQPGRSFAGEITRAIQNSKAMVLIFSEHSNNSEQVLREVQLAVNSRLHIIQFRIEDATLNDDLKYYLSTPHWLDALTPPLEKHLDRLTKSLKALLGTAAKGPSKGRETETAPLEPIAPEISISAPPRVYRATPIELHRSKIGKALAIIAVLICAGAAWWLGLERPRRGAERQLAEHREKEQQMNEALAQQHRSDTEKKLPEEASTEKERLVAEQLAQQQSLEKEKKLREETPAAKEPYESSLATRTTTNVGKYNVTGPLLEIDNRTIVIQKGKDRWEAVRTAATEIVGDPKVGEKVTLTYQMISSDEYLGFREYSVTGPILEVGNNMVSIQKGKDRWEIAYTSGTPKGKVGDRVTIKYTLLALKVAPSGSAR
jgi:TIR domain